MSTRLPAKAATGLADLLHTERRLVSQLIEILLQQRDAVAADDLVAIDRASHALQRSLFTLADARRRRRSVGQMLGAEDATLPRLDALLGDDMTAEIRDAREQLVAVAGALAREVETNRRILRQALAANDRYVAQIANIPDVLQYPSARPLSAPAAGTLLNCRV